MKTNTYYVNKEVCLLAVLFGAGEEQEGLRDKYQGRSWRDN